MFNNNFDNKIESIKKQTSHSILGAYLSGVAKDTIYLGKKTTIKGLGESFCKFGDAPEIDFSKRNLIDLNDIRTSPKSGGLVSNLISQANERIDDFCLSLKAANLPSGESSNLLLDLANTLQRSAMNIAYSEGMDDVDLKQDIRVLLKEGKEEFIKREQEEAQEMEELKDQQALEEDDFGEEEGFEDINDNEFDEGFDDEGGFIDDDGNPVEEGEEGEETEEGFDDFSPEDDEEMDDFGEDEEEEQEGTGESYAYGESRLQMFNYEDIVSRGYKINGVPMEKIVNEKEKEKNSSTIQKIFKWISDMFYNSDFTKGEMKSRDGVVKVKDGKVDVELDKIIKGGELDDLNNYVRQVMYNNSNIKRHVKNIAAVSLTLSGMGQPLFIGILKGIFAKPVGTIASAIVGTTMSPYEKLINTSVSIIACEKIIEELENLIPQAMKKADKGRAKAWTKLKEELEKRKGQFLKREASLKKKILAKNKMKAAAEAFNLPFECTFDEDKFNEALEERNLDMTYAEDFKYFYNEDIITTPPYEMEKMKKNLFEIEKSSIKALGESVGMARVLQDDDIQLQHKATVNELALIMMARNKYGFK